MKPEELLSIAVLLAVTIVAIAIVAVRRMRRNPSNRANSPSSRRKALVFGVGDQGLALADQLASHPDYQPVGFLGDNPERLGRSHSGIPVVGQRADIASAATSTGAEVLFITAGALPAKEVNAIAEMASNVGLDVLALPSGAGVLEAVALGRGTDLVGLAASETKLISIDDAAINPLLIGRTVMITGAGGRIGRALAAEIAGRDPGALVLVDSDSRSLAQVGELGETQRCDVTDREQLATLFEATSPDIVFHAAMLDSLGDFEIDPSRTIEVNVWGTANALDAALREHTTTFVTVSAGKAANPTSGLGATRALAERVTTWAARQHQDQFFSVRVGNLLGSRTSAILRFTDQIRAGGPVSLTHPDSTRYYIEPSDAARLILQSVAQGDPGEVVALDYPGQVAVVDIARRLIAWLNPAVDMEVTGLRPGEKLREDLVGTGEVGEIRQHEALIHIEGSTDFGVTDQVEGPGRAEVVANAAELDDVLKPD